MTGHDATAHSAKEIKETDIEAPWAITISLGFTYLGGWLFTIVLAYCSATILGGEVILESPMEQPSSQIFYNVLVQRAASPSQTLRSLSSTSQV